MIGEIDFQTMVVHGYKEEYLESILKLDPLFPIKIQDSKEKIIEHLTESANINVFLKKDESIIGWILGIPQNVAYADLKADDIDIKPDNAMYYIDKVVVFPGYREGTMSL
jgi:hypothetical protein